jgi:HSP20 family molecular chaperone IbpA
MSFFPRSFISEPATSFTPLFRLLDDFDNYQNSHKHHHRGGIMKSFSPKFDVKELPDAYELHGELPGVEQKDVEIEFTDLQTITVKGRTERSYTSGTPPAGLVESPKASGAITEGGETNNHHATVEDEGTEAKATEVVKADTKEAKSGAKEPDAKYWVSERSVGEFSRSFSFPVRVDQDAVQASMKNGILSILVPKSKKNEVRKITIN